MSSVIDLRKNPERLMKTDEVAKFFSVEEITIREWLRMGKLKGTKINTKWRVYAKDVIEYAEENYGA